MPDFFVSANSVFMTDDSDQLWILEFRLIFLQFYFVMATFLDVSFRFLDQNNHVSFFSSAARIELVLMAGSKKKAKKAASVLEYIVRTNHLHTGGSISHRPLLLLRTYSPSVFYSVKLNLESNGLSLFGERIQNLTQVTILFSF